MQDLIQEIDQVLSDFIQGHVEVSDFQEYIALERIAQILYKYRNQEPELPMQHWDFD